MSRGRQAVPALVVAAVLLGGCGGDGGGTAAGGAARPATTMSGDVRLGAQVFAARCAACHGDDGQGGFGPELAGGAVVERYPDVADHREVVVNGRGAMPAWGDVLSDTEVDAVVRYEREGL